MKIEKGHKVSIRYTLTNPEGEVLDSSEGRDALVYTAGAGEIIPGLDQALMGKCVGDHVQVTIAPEDAYGKRYEEAVQRLPREQLQNVPNLAEGMPLQAETPQGPFTVFVREVGEDFVVLDGNHPLAGITLTFTVDIENVAKGDEDPAAEEPKIILPN